MPNYNGTGPSSKGPMTGRGMGYCILKRDEKNSSAMEGVIGLAGNFYQRSIHQQKEMNDIPGGDITGHAGMRPFTGYAVGSYAGYPVPVYVNPALPGPVRRPDRLLVNTRPAYPPLPHKPGIFPYTGYPTIAWLRGKSRGRGWKRGRFFRF